MRDGPDLEGSHKGGNRAVRKRLAAGRREDEFRSGQALARFAQHRKRRARQWHPMRLAGFHAARRDGPECLVKMDFFPTRTPNLTGTSRCEHEKLERKTGREKGITCANKRKGSTDLRMRQRLIVHRTGARFWQRLKHGFRRTVRTVTLHDRPLHDGAEPLSQTTGGIVVGFPDGFENRQKIGGVDLGHELVSKVRVDMHLERALPDRWLPRIRPPHAMQRDHPGKRRFQSRHRRAVALRRGVLAFGNEPEVFEGLVTSRAKADSRVRANPRRFAFASERVTLLPVTATRRLDTQVEAVSVISTRNDLASSIAEGRRTEKKRLKRMLATPYEHEILQRDLVGASDADHRMGADAHVQSPTVDCDPLFPVATTGPTDTKYQAVRPRIPPRRKLPTNELLRESDLAHD